MIPDVDDPMLSLADLFQAQPAVARVFFRHRTACVGCPIAPFHTITNTCAEYHLDEAAFRAEIRTTLRAATAAQRRSAPQGGAVRPR